MEMEKKKMVIQQKNKKENKIMVQLNNNKLNPLKLKYQSLMMMQRRWSNNQAKSQKHLNNLLSQLDKKLSYLNSTWII